MCSQGLGALKPFLAIYCLCLVLGCKAKPSGAHRSDGALPDQARELGYSLQWEDAFHELDKTFWTIGLKDTLSGDMVPGAQGRYLLNEKYDAYYTPEDVYIEDGHLVLRNQKRNIKGSSPEGSFAYSSGWVMSMHKVFFNTGYLELKAQFPTGTKVWPAVWLIPEDLSWCPEWDLFEYFGHRNDRGPDLMGMHLCYDSWPNQKWASYFITEFDKKFKADKWHVYGFLWTSEYAIWYIDGKEVRRLEAKGIAGWPQKNMYIVLNNGTRTEAPEGDTKWPNYLKIDYIRLFSNG